MKSKYSTDAAFDSNGAAVTAVSALLAAQLPKGATKTLADLEKVVAGDANFQALQKASQIKSPVQLVRAILARDPKFLIKLSSKVALKK